jgi:2,5-diamino-6-(ribosylamino)-4(3H)-pyrimidinone 5'-phosphate reductase
MRPYVICYMCTSVDGKIIGDRRGKLPGYKHESDLFETTAASFGIGTDAKGVLRFQQNEVGGDHVVLLVTDRVSNDYLAHLQTAGVSYLFCGRKTVDLPTALRKLGSAFGLRKLMLQGGGKFNGAMLQAGLVDEVSHITVPVADGGGEVSTMFDGHASAKSAATLRLFSHKLLPGGAVWCRYKVVARHV